MSMTMHVIIDVLLAIGVFFVFVGVLGVIRSRMSLADCRPPPASPAWAIFS